MRITVCLTLLVFFLGACANSKKAADVHYGTPVQVSPSLKPNYQPQIGQRPINKDTTNRQKARTAGTSLATAATAPLDDFNLRRPIAPQALEDLGYIYQASPRPSCAAIARELYILKGALNELDADDEVVELTKRQKRTELASDTTLDVVRSTSSGLIPFSGIIRAASGANAAKRRYNQQFGDGRRRQAFLKGYALGIGCLPPVSPKVLQGPEPESDPEYRSPSKKPQRRVRR
ncbi:MAG: hypothetical protein JKY46_10020 [Robiginitomaculum sp.]|nr:hypothetical protein [Robiginitomaculum sp.]